MGETRVSLPPTVKAPALARRAIEQVLGPALEPETAYDAMLLVTELVTNSLRHGRLAAGDEIKLSIRLDPASGVAAIEVEDAGSGFAPHIAMPKLRQTTGRGLLLVDRLARRWGITVDGGAVWFEVPLRAGSGRSGGPDSSLSI